MKATATANANIALVKYWGKRDEKLFLPTNSSISMTTDKMTTTTTVDFDKKYKSDIFALNEKKISEEESENVSRHLNLIRSICKRKEKARVQSANYFPTAAGLASSASGFAALTLAAAHALCVSFNKKHLSIIARQGSGSASRSIFGGFVEWNRGEKSDGTDSFAHPIASENHWKDFCMIATVVQFGEKKVKSRAGMKQTVKTSPFYKSWLQTVGNDLNLVRKGILEKNFSLVGKTAEMNSLKMHATMLTTSPPIIYFAPATLKVIETVQELRESGTECYFTMDAGPQVKVLCLKKNAKKIRPELNRITGVKQTILCQPGSDAKLVQKHLF